jgi:hypothetical protein
VGLSVAFLVLMILLAAVFLILIPRMLIGRSLV